MTAIFQELHVRSGDAPMGVNFGDAGALVVNRGAGILSYGDTEQSARTPEGTIASGASTTLYGTQYFVTTTSATLAFLTLGAGPPFASQEALDALSNPALSTWVGRERFDVMRYGVSPGVTEPIAKLLGVVAEAAAVGGDVVFGPLASGGEWKYTGGTLQLETGVGLGGVKMVDQSGSSILTRVDTGPAVTFPNSGLGNYSQKGGNRLVGLEIRSDGDCLSIPNGGDDVYLDGLLLIPGLNAKGIHHRGFIQRWRCGPVGVRITGWKGSIAASASYGWYSDAEDGDGGDECRMDRCDWRILVDGCAESNFLYRIVVSDTVRLVVESTTCAKHGLILAGGLGGWVFDGPNFEGNGYLGAGLSVSPTTGTIAAGSLSTLTVASATGLTIGRPICIRRAADGLSDHVTTIANAVGTTITLAAPAGYAVTDADVTVALYDDVYAGADLGSPEALGTTLGGGPQNVSFIAPAWGLWPLRDDHMLRHAADLSGITAPRVVNAKATLRPMYDPGYLAESTDEDRYSIALWTPPRGYTGWQVPVMATGWTAQSTLAVRRRGRRVEVRGYAEAGGAATTTVCTLPPGCRPSRLITLPNAFVPGAAMQIDASGVVTNGTSTSGHLALGDHITFSID